MTSSRKFSLSAVERLRQRVCDERAGMGVEVHQVQLQAASDWFIGSLYRDECRG